MKLKELYLVEEAKENSLILLDIDDTLLTAKNIFIYRKLPSDKQEVKLTPEQYAKEAVTAEEKKYYDYREFRNPDVIARSIKTGIPIITNLKIMDDYINKGWRIGVLTARGMENVVFKSLKEWLKFKNKKGDLQSVGDKFIRSLMFAINDDEKHYPGATDFEKKANVIKNLSKNHNRIIFIDDDHKNIKLVKKLKLRNVMTRLAPKGTE